MTSPDLRTMGGRMKAAAKTAGVKQKEIASHFNITEQAVSQWFRDESTPDVDKIFDLARMIAVNPEWLVANKGERAPQQPEFDLDMAVIREFDLRAPSGAGGLLELHEENREEVVRHRYAFPRAEFRSIFGVAPEDVIIHEIIGDSMQGTLEPGQKVIVDMTDRSPSPPGIFVVWDGLALVTKRVEYIAHSDPPRVRIISDNKAYDPYERLLDEAYIQGRVVGSWHRR